MKLRPIEAYVEETKKKRKRIYIHSIDEDDESIWTVVDVISSKDSESLEEVDYWNIRELGDFDKALSKVRSYSP